MVSMSPSTSKLMLEIDDTIAFLEFQTQSLARKFTDINLRFSELDSEEKWGFDAKDVHFLVALGHLKEISTKYRSSIDYIEQVLRAQLTQAIGKELTVPEFSEYMSLYIRRILPSHLAPSQFALSVRVPGQHPQGTVIISKKVYPRRSLFEEKPAETMNEPILVITREKTVTHPMMMKLNDSTRIKLVGNHYIHGHLAHSFSDELDAKMSLNVSCNRFGCYVLIIGRIYSPNIFEPKSAVLLQGKGTLYSASINSRQRIL